MTALCDACQGFPEVTFPAGSVLVAEGARTGALYVLIDGEVTVLRGGVEVATIKEAGSVFGEMSILLDTTHSATVVARQPSRAYAIEDGAAFIRSHPDVMFHVGRILALRLHLLTSYLVDVKQQFADRSDHLNMVDVILESLSQQQDLEFTPGSDREPHTGL